MKTILITGISRGLGKELFKLFVSKGYEVFGVLRDKVLADQIERDSSENGKTIIADLSADEAIGSIREAVQDKPIDLLINNAGISGKLSEFDDIETGELMTLFNTHCLGVLRTIQSVKNNLLKSKEPIVINMNSRLGSITRQNNGTYSHLELSYSYRIAKASQNMLTCCLRNEFEDYIRFISLHPGKMKTDISSSDADVEPHKVAQKIFECYDHNAFREENGITQLDGQTIEW